MRLYTIELFLHVAGAMAIFTGYGVLLFGMAALRRAKTVDEVRAIVGPMVAGRRVGLEHVSVIDAVVVVGVLLVIINGLAMALAAWGLTRGWIDVAFGSLVVLGPVGPFVVNPRLHAIATEAAEVSEGPVPSTLSTQIHSPVLAASLQGGAGILLGIVFLMTNKPSVSSSVIVMVIALVIGLGSSLPTWRASRRRSSLKSRHQGDAEP